MTPEVKRAYDKLMEAYDALRKAAGAPDKKRKAAEWALNHAAEMYYSELMCPARKPAALANADATRYAIDQCHDLVAMMRTWKPIYATA